MKKLQLSITFFLILLSLPVRSQVKVEITLDEFLYKIQNANIEYLAERLNMEIAEASIISASVFNNPSIGLSYYNNELKSMQMGHGAFAELSQTISPGRRSAAIDVAKSEKELAAALLTDYFRKLREEAVNLWLDAVKLRQLIQIKKDSYDDQIKLMESDSLRRGIEFNRDLDILQNRVETGKLFAELADMDKEMFDICIQLTNMSGISVADSMIVPQRRNIFNEKYFDLQELLAKAIANRADILAARKETDVSKYMLKAAKTERIPEFDVFLGYGINAEVRNELAPAPKFNGFEVGISFPIPLFNRNKGEIMSAKSQLKQAEYRYLQAENQVKEEVVTAHKTYMHTSNKLNLFKSGLVKNAKDALEQKKSQYYNREIHLIEVLDAQRSYDEVLASFYSAIYDKSQALVTLESAVGVWNIE